MVAFHQGSYDVNGCGGGDRHGGRVASTLAAAAAAGHGAGRNFHDGERLGGSRVEGGNFCAALAVDLSDSTFSLLAVDLGAGGLSLRQSVSCGGSSLVETLTA